MTRNSLLVACLFLAAYRTSSYSNGFSLLVHNKKNARRSSSSLSYSSTPTRCNDESNHDRISVSRKTFVDTLLVVPTLLLPLVPATASPAHAQEGQVLLLDDDVTARQAAALRNVKSCQKKLASPTLQAYIETAEYVPLKEALRVEPFSKLRKSCQTLIRGGSSSSSSRSSEPQQQDQAKQLALQLEYKKFIAALEKMDSVASLGMRGRQLGPHEFSDAYQATQTALNDFVDLAEQQQ